MITAKEARELLEKEIEKQEWLVEIEEMIMQMIKKQRRKNLQCY